MTESYDALLLLSFGGPEGPDDVMPFLRNVVRGRGVPDERLAEVAEHYRHFGGVSPINEQNRQLLAAIKADFAANGVDLPVYWGNRNWHPMLTDTLRQMYADGVRKALVFITSAYCSYSSCQQYHEDLAKAHVDGLETVVLRRFFNHPGFIEPHVDAVRGAYASLLPKRRDDARLVFTAHSIPTRMDEQAGPTGHLYSRELREAARLVAEQAAPNAQWDLVWQSRSGPPQVPWLEPDINDHLEAIAADGVTDVVISPIGFVSDHLEVLWDLDNEARETAYKLGLGFARAATPGTDRRFVAMVRELVLERTAGAEPRALGDFAAPQACTDLCADLVSR
ncbi:ferrochelatase [Fodinicola acaciae]|uniref:ferrochelatase n=1 Tax=Fodinicola acaciae TaxID=2681555 RepID=UPI0013D5B95C|nr:ferrochelatase [Fodinicola acaciae]